MYTVIAKSLADRIKPFLPNKFHMSQSAFIPGRHIASFNYYHCPGDYSLLSLPRRLLIALLCLAGIKKGFLLKIDLAKAFDRIEWIFIGNAMIRAGFF